MLLCTLLGHRRPDRHKVWNDGLDFRSSCRRCAAPLIRDHQSHRWRAFASEDHDMRRMGKPIGRSDAPTMG